MHGWDAVLSIGHSCLLLGAQSLRDHFHQYTRIWFVGWNDDIHWNKRKWKLKYRTAQMLYFHMKPYQYTNPLTISHYDIAMSSWISRFFTCFESNPQMGADEKKVLMHMQRYDTYNGASMLIITVMCSWNAQGETFQKRIFAPSPHHHHHHHHPPPHPKKAVFRKYVLDESSQIRTHAHSHYLPYLPIFTYSISCIL